jgi:uncharacterized membrane protein
MPGWLKALLIVVIVVVLLMIGVVAGGVYLLSRGKDAVIARSKASEDEGRDFGRRSDYQGCVDESVSRYRREPGFINSISASLFMRACLDNSRGPARFCADVPSRMNFAKTPEWKNEQCRHFDLASDKYSPELFVPLQQFCEEKLSRSNDGSRTNSH